MGDWLYLHHGLCSQMEASGGVKGGAGEPRFWMAGRTVSQLPLGKGRGRAQGPGTLNSTQPFFFFFPEKDVFTTQKIPGYFRQPEDPEASPLILSLFLDGDINKENQNWGHLGSRRSGPVDGTRNAQMARLGVPGPPWCCPMSHPLAVAADGFQ